MSHGVFEDHLRMLTNCGVKFAGRAVYQWRREEGGAAGGERWYEMHRPSVVMPNGFGQEETIRQIWAADQEPRNRLR